MIIPAMMPTMMPTMVMLTGKAFRADGCSCLWFFLAVSVRAEFCLCLKRSIAGFLCLSM